jgi:hypothetical protein
MCVHVYWEMSPTITLRKPTSPCLFYYHQTFKKKWPKFCVPHFGGAVQPPLAGAVWAFPRGPRAWTTEDSAQLGRQNGRRLRPGRTAASSRRTEAARDQPPRAPGSRRPPTEPVGQVSCVGALGGDRRTPRQPSHPFNLQCTDSYGAPTS